MIVEDSSEQFEEHFKNIGWDEQYKFIAQSAWDAALLYAETGEVHPQKVPHSPTMKAH